MLGPGLPHTLADAAQLQQVVLNLIVNAEQAIVQGRGKRREVAASTSAPGVFVRGSAGMEVSDDGPGMASEIVSRIFDPFFTTKPVGVGTGWAFDRCTGSCRSMEEKSAWKASRATARRSRSSCLRWPSPNSRPPRTDTRSRRPRPVGPPSGQCSGRPEPRVPPTPTSESRHRHPPPHAPVIHPPFHRRGRRSCAAYQFSGPL